MKRFPFTASDRSSQKTTGIVVMLITVLLLLLLWGPRIGLGLMSGSASGLGTPKVGVAHGSYGDFFYFCKGQWMADIRTLLAACRYVLEPETA